MTPDAIRVLELLADGEVRGVMALADDAGLTVRRCTELILVELRDVVELRPNGLCPLVRAKPGSRAERV